jgi:peptidyl-prolyl cis-trans isomerase A (cyclophilin A)
MSQLPKVKITTPLGDIVVAVDLEHAPISATNFLAYVDQGLLEGTTIHRIVSMENQPDTVPAKIEVIQFGHLIQVDHYPTPLPYIAHEPTSKTGLRHRDGTLSMARFAPGSASSGFFICVGDQPELDEGGKRQPDGQGFAAFGWVEEGMDVVRALHAKAESSDNMVHPIPLLSVSRV